MKIERVEVFGVAVPLIGEYKNAYLAKTVQKSAIVRITASGGVVGLGNIDPGPGYSKEGIVDHLRVLDTVLKPLLVGMDPCNIHEVMARIEPAIEGFLDSKAAIEMACVDLAARAQGVAVHTWLGGAVRKKLRSTRGSAFCRRNRRRRRRWSGRSAASVRPRSRSAAASRPTATVCKAVREAVGPEFGLRIDANAGYDVDTSIKLARMVAPFKLQLFEQPVPADDIAGMARVRKAANAVGVIIMADESLLDHASLIDIIRADAADMVKVKVMKQGGFLNTRRMIATAEAAGMKCVVGHGFGLGINTMAEIMLAATSGNVIDGLECVGPLKTADDIVTHKLDLGSGSLDLPGGPGLGVVLDDAKIASYRFEAAHA